MMYSLVFKCITLVLMIWFSQSEFMPLLHSEHIYEVFPTRKIYKMNFKWECWGYRVTTEKRACEEGPGNKTVRFYRRLHSGTLKETLTMKWNPTQAVKTMWLNTSYRSLNDYIELSMTVPMDLWDYDYADQPGQTTNMSIELTGSHIKLWYNNYKVTYIWLRDMGEDILYTTHVKLEEGFYQPPAEKKADWKNGSIFWYFGDESMWCWEKCSQKNVFNFSGYYDEVLSPRTDEYQSYELRTSNPWMNGAYCTYVNCTRRYENFARCLMINFTVWNTTLSPPIKETLLDLRCINDTYDLDKEIKDAKEYWKHYNISRMERSNWNQHVPDDPLGIGIVNGVYKCLNRDYCHDLRPFQLFNFEGSAHIIGCDVMLVVLLVSASLLLQLQD